MRCPLFRNSSRGIESLGLLTLNWDSAGSFKRPLFGDDETTCIGVETTDGTKYYADKVVLATGAWSPTLVELEEQCCSKVGILDCTDYTDSHKGI